MIELFKSIVRIPSTSNNLTACREVLEYIRDYIGSGIIDFHNTKPYLIVKNYDFDVTESDIILNGHIDVVPPSEEGQFDPIEKNGKLYARGSGDMKAGVSIIVQVMKNLRDNLYTDKRIMLILTSDEEVGGFDGVGYLTQQGYTAPLILIPDAGSLHEVVTGEKGLLTIQVTTSGKEGHSSRPWFCDNAIEKLYDFYHALQHHIQEPEKLIAPDYRSSTVQLTKIHAGKADNVIPGEAQATINIRYTERFTLESLQYQINILSQQYNTAVQYNMHGSLLYSDSTHPVIQSYIDYATTILKSPVKMIGEHGASDGRFFAEQGSVVVLHRPTCENIHGKNERIQLSDMKLLLDVYYGFITK